MTRQIVIATHNPGKLHEFQQALKTLNCELVSQKAYGIDEPYETGSTFVENAVIKARNVCQLTGNPAIADDSGLQVDALGGAPGVKSARYSGESRDDQSNIAKLLQKMQQVPDAKRAARFHCVSVYLRHAEDPGPIICEGIWEGLILHSGQSDSGFGYDPVFYIPSQQCTAAELSTERKNQLSHRGQALRCIVSQLKREFSYEH